MMLFHTHLWRLVFLVSIFTLPVSVSAQLYISEVAWMGRTDNANAEWIELHNAGEVQSLEGWTLVANDGQPSITLSGSIGGGEYVLLERTSDETVPGVSALVVYTGALGNSGEVLELRDATGAAVDLVDGLPDWEIGGDNTTKDTLQRAGGSAGGAWITAPQTPGGATVSTGSPRKEQNDDIVKPNTINVLTGSPESPKVVVPKVTLNPALTLDIGDDVVTTVGAPVRLVARTYKEGGREILLDDVRWTFGDGAQGTGRTVRHAYAYEGEYVVYAKGNRSGLYEGVSDTARMVVRVVPASLRITDATVSYIELENTGADELDISGYIVASGEDYHRFPSRTYVLPGARVRFPSSITFVTPYPDMLTVLYSPARVPVSEYPSVLAPSSVSKKDSQVVQEVKTQQQTSSHIDASPPTSSTIPTAGSTQKEVMSAPSIIVPELAYAGGSIRAEGEGSPHATTSTDGLLWWILGVLGTTLLAVVVALLVRREQSEIIAGYEIEEEK